MTELTLIINNYYYNHLRNIEVIMSKENKNQVYSMILILNLVLGLYNFFLFSIGNSFFNLLIGSMNVGVWTFCRDKNLMIYIKNRIIKSNIK